MVYAAEVIQEGTGASAPQKQTSSGGIFSSADDFLKKGQSGADNSSFNETALRRASGTLYNTLLAVGVVLTAIIGGVLGIKFMIASAEDKAQIKEMMIPYVIGCIVIYGAFGIWKLVATIGSQLG